MKYIKPVDQALQKHEIIPPVRNHPSKKQHFVTPISAPLYVVTAITNPNRYYSRYKLYQAFEKMVEDAGGILYTIELALRDRHFEITDHDNPHHIQLRSPSQLWHKENLLNLAIARLPENWEYVAWVDSDIKFARPDWANETLHLLQHYKIVQMFSHSTDLSPVFEPYQTQTGFVYSWVKGQPQPVRINSKTQKGYPYYGHALWHSGYCWAARRSALSDLGGLGDIAILGSGDHHMACALIGRVMESIHGSMNYHFKEYWLEWQKRAMRYIDGNIGYMPGNIWHYWHGKKKDRGYIDRWKILVDQHFDPKLDLKKDVQGILTLTERNPKLRDMIRHYFSSRNEDSIDM